MNKVLNDCRSVALGAYAKLNKDMISMQAIVCSPGGSHSNSCVYIGIRDHSKT
ncbi:MAG: hypothetical protein JKX98_11340 [Alcanivoracaceae bacterium]|nr:hypothetical protein [Alcanivoracaceae bacterium]